MKKLFVFLIVLLVIFLFRGQITGYWIQFFGAGKEDPMAWLVQKRDSLYPALPAMDFTTATESLSDFENAIESSLAELEKSTDDERKKKSYRRNLICELAVVYQKRAMVYTSNHDDNRYTEYIRKSQDQFVECAALR